jgi:protein SCO1
VTPAMRRGLLAFFLGLVVILAGFALDRWWLGDGTDSGGLAGVPIGGPFALTDQNGILRRDSKFKGELMLVYFGYTFCPDACPAELNTMSAALDKIGDRAREVQPIFISVDPARDTVVQMKLYASNFTPRLLALTGTRDQVAAAARAYRVFFQKATSENGDDYAVDHSAFVYLMGRDGRYLGHFGPDVTAEQMAAAIKKYL